MCRLTTHSHARASLIKSTSAKRFENACHSGKLEDVKYLVDLNKKLVNLGDVHGRAAIHWCASEGNLEVLKYVHENGAGIHERTDRGWTALMYASYKGHKEIVSYLLSCNVHTEPEDFAEGWTALMLSAEKGHFEVLQNLVLYGANINAQSKQGWSALLISCDGGYFEPSEFLLQHGADHSQKTSKGTTAVMLAAQKGDERTLKLLLESGADANARNKKGLTALMMCAQSRQVGTAKVLLQYGAEVDVKTVDQGWTTLMLCAEEGLFDLACVLVEYGADVNSISSSFGYSDFFNYILDSQRRTDINLSSILIEDYVRSISDAMVTSPIFQTKENYFTSPKKNECDSLFETSVQFHAQFHVRWGTLSVI